MPPGAGRHGTAWEGRGCYKDRPAVQCKHRAARRRQPAGLRDSQSASASRACTSASSSTQVSIVMDVRLVLLACVVGVAVCQTNCGGKDCPRYTVVESGEGWELRNYEASKWVSTPASSNPRDERRQARLIKQYFRGSNAGSTRMSKTTPVVKKMEGGVGGTPMTTRTMMMLPQANQASPPTPTDSSLEIVNMPATRLYSSLAPAGDSGSRGSEGRRQQGGRGRRPGRRQPRAANRRGGNRRGGNRRGGGDSSHDESMVDALRTALGDRTTVEGLHYHAYFGKPGRPSTPQEIWLQAA